MVVGIYVCMSVDIDDILYSRIVVKQANVTVIRKLFKIFRGRIWFSF